MFKQLQGSYIISSAHVAPDFFGAAPALLCILSRGAFGLAHGAVQEVALAAARAHLSH